ncbi:hypothetical protein [Enterococcus sp. CWB-B31]|uniref:hypothetical protein n=1 Tax=Enterococcus sp. CWB-B31 TaxID=2885159 RepID=UPI001E43EBC6|nr:hypothetical protein [Enterococcus sp. CWB-B31]MCB5954026.1 hypothetical protein [Enterococcus sp. CWB-B31]
MKKITLLVLSIIFLSACNSQTASTTNSSSSQPSSEQNANSSTTNTAVKTLTGDLTVGKDIMPGIYNIKAIGDGYGTVSLLSADGEEMPFREYMASTEGKERLQKFPEAGDPENYSEEILGLTLRDGETIKIRELSISFSSVQYSETDKTKILTSNLSVGENGDLTPGTYDLKAVGDGYGTVSVLSADGEEMPFREYMASPEGKERVKVFPEAGDSEIYSKARQGLTLHEGETLRIRSVSIEFTKVD